MEAMRVLSLLVLVHCVAAQRLVTMLDSCSLDGLGDLREFTHVAVGPLPVVDCNACTFASATDAVCDSANITALKAQGLSVYLTVGGYAMETSAGLCWDNCDFTKVRDALTKAAQDFDGVLLDYSRLSEQATPYPVPTAGPAGKFVRDVTKAIPRTAHRLPDKALQGGSWGIPLVGDAEFVVVKYGDVVSPSDTPGQPPLHGCQDALEHLRDVAAAVGGARNVAVECSGGCSVPLVKQLAGTFPCVGLCQQDLPPQVVSEVRSACPRVPTATRVVTPTEMATQTLPTSTATMTMESATLTATALEQKGQQPPTATVVLPKTPKPWFSPSLRSCDHLDALFREMQRQQRTEYNGRELMDPTDEKHTPRIDISEGVATVNIGTREKPHPTVLTPSEVHYIDRVAVLSDKGHVVAYSEIHPPEVLTFRIPKGVSQLIPYSYCNKHGLFKGAVYPVTPSADAPYPACSATSCVGSEGGVKNVITGATADALRATIEMRQVRAFGQPLQPNNDKHIPIVTLSGNVATIVVGKPTTLHVMEPEHFISAIYATDQDNRVVAYGVLSPTEPAPAVLMFTIPKGTTSLTPFEYCNLHGLFKGEPVTVPSTTEGGLPNTTLAEVAKCLPPPLPCRSDGCLTFGSLAEEMMRKQMFLFEKPIMEENPSDLYVKHTPTLTFNSSTNSIRVIVGDPAKQLVHPMVWSSDDSVVHFIERIWVVDQNNVTIAMRDFSDPDAAAVLETKVPPGTTEVTAYEYCNKHGLYKSKPLTVTLSSAAPLPQPTCELQGGRLLFGKSSSWEAEYRRVQKAKSIANVSFEYPVRQEGGTVTLSPPSGTIALFTDTLLRRFVPPTLFTPRVMSFPSTTEISIFNGTAMLKVAIPSVPTPTLRIVTPTVPISKGPGNCSICTPCSTQQPATSAPRSPTVTVSVAGDGDGGDGDGGGNSSSTVPSDCCPRAVACMPCAAPFSAALAQRRECTAKDENSCGCYEAFTKALQDQGEGCLPSEGGPEYPWTVEFTWTSNIFKERCAAPLPRESAPDSLGNGIIALIVIGVVIVTAILIGVFWRVTNRPVTTGSFHSDFQILCETQGGHAPAREMASATALE